MGSDGSLKHEKCTYGFVLDCGKANNSAWGRGKCPDHVGKWSSLRAELFGMMATIILIKAIRNTFKQDSKWGSDLKGFTAYVDNKTAIGRVEKNKESEPRVKTRRDYLCSEYNVGNKMNDILDEVGLEGRWKWVKAHTDGKKPEQIINRFADELADIAHNDKEITTSEPTSGRPILQLQGKEISSKIRSQIIEYAMVMKSKRYWEKKREKEEYKESLIPRKIGGCIKKFKKGNQRTIIKAIHGWTPVLSRKHCETWHHTNMCPICKRAPETHRHFLTCGYKNNPKILLWRTFCSHQRSNPRRCPIPYHVQYCCGLHLQKLRHWHSNQSYHSPDFSNHFLLWWWLSWRI